MLWLLGSFRACKLEKGEGRSGSHERPFYCVNVNRTSLDHLLLGEGADIDEMSHGVSIAPHEQRSRPYFWRYPVFRHPCQAGLLLALFLGLRLGRRFLCAGDDV